MPFITNDFHYLLVDDDEFYTNREKYKHYVVARRLLVTSQKSFTAKYLKERFQKYGDIESTKILKSKVEGFVTFTCDRHACLAYDWEKDKCKDKRVRVDSTWHQPDQGIRIDSEWNTYEYDDDDDSMELDDSMDETVEAELLPPLLRLNDDDLFALFDRCDNLSLVNLSRTCRRLEILLKSGKYYFPNHKSFHKQYADKWSLIDLENVFELMGRHLNKLDVWFDDWAGLETILCYVQIISKYCHGGKLKDLSLVMTSWNNEVWYELRPVLKNLSKLHVCINDCDDEEVTADLTELCPNLDTLILYNSFIVGKSLTKIVPSLKTFIFPYSWNDLVGLDNFEFFYANRQLKEFECREFDFENVQLLLHILPNIETLRLFVEDDQITGKDVLSLQNFQNLRSMKLCFFFNHQANQRRKIIDGCGLLNNLLELKLYFYKTKYEIEPAVNLSNVFGHLERLQLTGISLDERSVSDFIRKASKIKVMHFHDCDVYATESLLTQLRDILRQSSQFHRNERSLFIGDELNNNFISIINREVKSVRWKCDHRYFC